MAFSAEMLKRAEERKAEYESHIKPGIREFFDTIVANRTKINQEMWDELFRKFGGLNSYERELLYSVMDDELLIKTVRYSVSNCGRLENGPYRPCSTYKEAVIHLFAPMLLKRLEERDDEIRQLKDSVDKLTLEAKGYTFQGG